MNKTELLKIFYGIAENYNLDLPGKQYVDFMHSMFVDDGITIEQVKMAAKMIIKTKKESFGKMPPYAEYLEIIQGSQDQIAELEAQKVIALVNYEGRYADYKHRLSPETIAAIDNRFGGYDSLCITLETGKLNWFVKEFKEAYSAIKTQPPQISHDEARQLLTNIPKLKAV